MFNWPQVTIKVESKIITNVYVTVGNPPTHISKDIKMDAQVAEMAGGSLDSNLVAILWGLVKTFLGLDTPLATIEEFKAKIAAVEKMAEFLASLTGTTADDDLVKRAEAFLANEAVIQVLWAVYHQFVKEPTLAAEMTPERFGELLKNAAEGGS